jgi:hypothetical protein
MRTTLDIDDRVLASARTLAHDKGISLGSAVSELALRGLRPTAIASTVSGSPFPTFPTAPDADPVTSEMVREALDEG